MILWHNCCYATVRTPVNFVTIPNIVTFVEVQGLDLNAKGGNGQTILEAAKEVVNQIIEKLLKEKCGKWLL